MSNWYVWSINQQRYGKVKEFLSELEEIENFIYPVVEKEYITKKGKKKKNVPVYSNYIFIQYDHNSEIAVKIKKCQWIRSYVGPCSESEIKQIKLMNGKNYDDVMPNDYGIKPGMLVVLRKNGLFATIVDVKGDVLTVSIDIFGQSKVFTCNIDDIEIDN